MVMRSMANGSLLTPLLVRRARPALVMAAGMVLAAVGFGLLTQLDPAAGLAVLVAGSVAFSLGSAPMTTLATDLMVGTAPPERAGAASGVSETSSEFGGALGIAVLGSIASAVYRGQMTDAVPTGIPPHAAEAARDTLGGAVAVAGQLPDQLGAALLDTAREAFTQGVQLSFAISAVVAVGIAVLVAALLRHVGVGSESEQQPAPSQDGSGCAGEVGVVKVQVTPPGRGPGLENTSACWCWP
jgi:MFS transporter, DHA2 family, multidrug resistance protein